MTSALLLPNWWPVVLERMLGVHPDDAAVTPRYAAALRRLSEYLNDTPSRRHATRPYLRDRVLRETYLLYYATANMLKVLPPLLELRRGGGPGAMDTGDGSSDGAPLRVLDLGCGPGTGVAALHAFLETLPEAPAVEMLALDAVAANTDTATALAAHLRDVTGRKVTLRTETADLAHPPELDAQFDLILGMNVLNELATGPASRLRAWLTRHLAPQGDLLLIEPALRETSRMLLEYRDAAVKEDWTVFAPCFRQGGCPALRDAGDWCHHDVAWERPAFMAALDEEVGNIKKSLKFSFLLLNRDGRTLRDHIALRNPQRVVSELLVEKGRARCFVCGTEGRRMVMRNRRDRREGNAAFDRIERYDIVEVTGEEQRAHDMRIPAEGAVRRIPWVEI